MWQNKIFILPQHLSLFLFDLGGRNRLHEHGPFKFCCQCAQHYEEDGVCVCVCVCVCFKESGSCSNTVGLVKKLLPVF